MSEAWMEMLLIEAQRETLPSEAWMEILLTEAWMYQVSKLVSHFSLFFLFLRPISTQFDAYLELGIWLTAILLPDFLIIYMVALSRSFPLHTSSEWGWHILPPVFDSFYQRSIVSVRLFFLTLGQLVFVLDIHQDFPTNNLIYKYTSNSAKRNEKLENVKK